MVKLGFMLSFKPHFLPADTWGCGLLCVGAVGQVVPVNQAAWLFGTLWLSDECPRWYGTPGDLEASLTQTPPIIRSCSRADVDEESLLIQEWGMADRGDKKDQML